MYTHLCIMFYATMAKLNSHNRDQLAHKALKWLLSGTCQKKCAATDVECWIWASTWKAEHKGACMLSRFNSSFVVELPALPPLSK